MSRVFRRTVLCFLSFAIASQLLLGCFGQSETAPQLEKTGSLQDEPWFRSALSFLATIQDKLSDPAMRAEVRIRLLARDDAGAFGRLGFSREDLGAFLARQEIMRTGLEQRWPGLNTHSLTAPATDPRADFLEGLSADEWRAPAKSSSKEFYTCAVITFYAEFHRCTLASGDIYSTMGCVITAYWNFLENLARGC